MKILAIQVGLSFYFNGLLSTKRPAEAGRLEV